MLILGVTVLVRSPATPDAIADRRTDLPERACRLPPALPLQRSIEFQGSGGTGSAGPLAAGPSGPASVGHCHQETSRSGVAPIRWMERSAPSNSSSWVRRRPTRRLRVP